VLNIGNNAGGPGTVSSPPVSATFSSDQSDWARASAIFTLITASTNINITGMQSGQNGELAILWNAGASNTITLPNASVSSAIANRWHTSTGAALSLQPGSGVLAQYDSTAGNQGWRVAPLGGVNPVNGTATGLTLNTHFRSLGTATDASGTTTFDATAHELWQTTLANNTALLVSGAKVGETIELWIIQGSTAYTPTWSGTNTITWFNAGSPYGPPGMPVTAGAIMKVSLVCTGTNTFHGHWLGNTGP
jgi:hypothetical protein